MMAGSSAARHACGTREQPAHHVAVVELVLHGQAGAQETYAGHGQPALPPPQQLQHLHGARPVTHTSTTPASQTSLAAGARRRCSTHQPPCRAWPQRLQQSCACHQAYSAWQHKQLLRPAVIPLESHAGPDRDGGPCLAEHIVAQDVVLDAVGVVHHTEAQQLHDQAQHRGGDPGGLMAPAQPCSLSHHPSGGSECGPACDAAACCTAMRECTRRRPRSPNLRVTCYKIILAP